MVCVVRNATRPWHQHSENGSCYTMDPQGIHLNILVKEGKTAFPVEQATKVISILDKINANATNVI